MKPGQTQHPSTTVQPVRPPFVALQSAFLRRTVASTLITTLLVATVAALKFDAGWGWRYMQASLWVLIFFGLTALILKALLFERRMVLGFALMAVKFAWLFVLIALFGHWTAQPLSMVALGSSVVAGIATPLVVVTLRVLGSFKFQPRAARHHVTEVHP